MPRLVLLSEGMTGRTYDLTIERTTVGRSDENAFTIAEGSVSSRHAELILQGENVLVRDLNSTNGTFINGEQVTGEALLKPGQILRLGLVEMRLESGAPAAPAKKAQEHTIMIPQGVKLGQGDVGNNPSGQGITSVFKKKSDRSNKVFLLVVVGVVIAVIGIIAFAFLTFNQR
jgi:hypothetical protein